MQRLYMILAGVHVLAVVATGALWTWIMLRPHSNVRRHLRDVRAVHFGSLYLVPWLLGLAYAFKMLNVPAWQQVIFPAGLGALVFFSGIGWVFPLPDHIDPFYFWTYGWGKVFSLLGLAFFVISLVWTAAVLILYGGS